MKHSNFSLFSQRCFDLAASARLANLPTVWSNVFVGLFLANYLDFSSSSFSWNLLWVLLPIGSLLYLAGTFGNDWADSSWDAQHKPSRAIASGRIPRSLMGVLALSSLGIALLLSQLLSEDFFLASCVLVATIGLYTLLHKRTAWAIGFMGLARFLLPVLAFAACGIGFGNKQLIRIEEIGYAFTQAPLVSFGLFLAYPLALWFWTVGLSFVAREEAHKDNSRLPHSLWLVLASLLCALAVHYGIESLRRPIMKPYGLGPMNWTRLFLVGIPPLGLITFWVFLAWKQQRKAQTFVPRMLAGFCLLDALVLCAISPLAALVCLSLFFFALFLQRYAPAT